MSIKDSKSFSASDDTIRETGRMAGIGKYGQVSKPNSGIATT
jgi:hypothetical protein